MSSPRQESEDRSKIKCIHLSRNGFCANSSECPYKHSSAKPSVDRYLMAIYDEVKQLRREVDVLKQATLVTLMLLQKMSKEEPNSPRSPSKRSK